MSNSVLVQQHARQGVALITLNRPDVLNALNAELLASLSECLQPLAVDPSIKALVITGAGPKAFAAGADINEIRAMSSPGEAETLALRGQSVFAKIENFPKPVVAAVNGYAFGGGLELAMACHQRIFVETALVGQPEVNLGIIPGYGGTQRLPRLIGLEKAWEMLRNGKPVDAKSIASLGLGTLSAPEALLETAYNVALEMSLSFKGSPIAKAPLPPLANAPVIELGHLSTAIDAVLRQAIIEGATGTLATGLALEAKLFGRCFTTKDSRIGLDNFATNGPKVKANFVNA